MPAALEDPTQPPHYRPDMVVPELEPYTVLLKDRETTATIYPISSADQLPLGLLAFLCDEFNMEIERGDSFPLFDTLHIDTFQNYWFGSFAGVMLIGDAPTIQDRRQWEKECLGTFYIKPNYPGRCSHICTAGFLVNAGIRGKGIGRTLAECYLEWAPKLGYTYSVFNLVFETNIMARRIWESLNFKRVGRIKGAGILKGVENAVDALIYGRELVEPVEEAVGELRFDKIKYYLETGKYPPNSDRQEKSRLRSSAAHYRLRTGKLMLKDREVVAEPERQLAIATELHMQSHAGINKTTSQITERYHWTRIKDTVAIAIRNCQECRETTRPPPKRNKKFDDVDSVVAAAAGNASAAAAEFLNAGHHARHHNPLPHPDLRRVQDPGLLAAGLGMDADDETNQLMAAVAAAQPTQQDQQVRHPQLQQRSQQQIRHHSPQQIQAQQQHIQHPVDDRLRSTQHYSPYHHPPHYGPNPHSASHDEIPVDPQVESAFEEHVHGGEEIAIARALIQANESVPDDNNNLFS
jgi:GNAT superfamily N-acetyltransferase